MRCAAWVAWLWLGASGAVFASSVYPWVDAGSRPAVLEGRFEQIKTLQGFSRPLNSTGRFLAVRGRGLLWQTHSPFEMETRITADEIVQRSEGKVVQRMRTAEDRVAKGVSQILLSLFEGNTERLDQHFSSTMQTGSDGWSVHLVPLGFAMKQVVSGIFLRGSDRYIAYVRIEEVTGDRTELSFHDHREYKAVEGVDRIAFE